MLHVSGTAFDSVRLLLTAVAINHGASMTDGPWETAVAYSGLLRANTVLCSFNAIQPSSIRTAGV